MSDAATGRLGHPVRAYPIAVSVDALALAWARQDAAPEGAMVRADQELAARGRRGAPWISVAGGSLAVAVVLRPPLPAEAEGLVWLLAAVAAADGLAAVTGLDVAVEWPNELRVNGQGIGIAKATVQLGPGRIELAVLSMRLNTSIDLDVLPDERRDRVTTLARHGVDVDDDALVDGFLRQLEAHYAGGSQALLAAYTQRCATLGHDVAARLVRRGEIHGRATDVDEHGRLVLATPGGAAAIDLTTLEHLRRR